VFAGMGMSLHGVTWRVNASALDNMDLLEDSLRWISGGKSTINRSKDKSFHGSEQYSIVAKTQKRKEAIESLKKLGEKVLTDILEEGINKRIDDSKNLHIRLELSKLVAGEIFLANKKTISSTVKGKFKIESYPGEETSEVITKLIENILDNN
jgi:RNA binding exosome subunit